MRGKTRTTTKRAWFPAEGGKSAGAMLEREDPPNLFDKGEGEFGENPCDD